MPSTLSEFKSRLDEHWANIMHLILASAVVVWPNESQSLHRPPLAAATARHGG